MPEAGLKTCTPWLLSVFVVAADQTGRRNRSPRKGGRSECPMACSSVAPGPVGPRTKCHTACEVPSVGHGVCQVSLDWACQTGGLLDQGRTSGAESHLRGCYCGEQVCLCGPGLVSSAGDAGCSERGLTEPECWLIHRSHKGCCLLWIAGRWP